MRVCSECERPVGAKGARGYCTLHYKRFKKYGAPVLPPAYVIPECAIPGCPGKAKARGWCATHYQRWRKRGNPEFEFVRPLELRLWERVDMAPGQGPKGDCWEWQGARHKHGHGQILGSKGKVIYAHRAAWEVTNGAIPEGMFACHRCDNPPCVRPEHLFLGTANDNAQDMIAKGRGAWQQGVPGRAGVHHERYLRTKSEHPLEAERLGLSKRRTE